MRPVFLASVPSDPQAKLDWCVRAIQQIARSSQSADPNVVADGFALSNVTESRTLNAGGGGASHQDLVDVVATFLQDLQKRGSKGDSV